MTPLAVSSLQKTNKQKNVKIVQFQTTPHPPPPPPSPPVMTTNSIQPQTLVPGEPRARTDNEIKIVYRKR